MVCDNENRLAVAKTGQAMRNAVVIAGAAFMLSAGSSFAAGQDKTGSSAASVAAPAGMNDALSAENDSRSDMTPMPSGATPPPVPTSAAAAASPVTPSSASVPSPDTAVTPSLPGLATTTQMPAAAPGAVPAAPPALSAQDGINGPASSTVAINASAAASAPPSAATGKTAGATRPLAPRKGDDEYYDSKATTVPSNQMAPAVGPRKVNPAVEPGQTLVIVDGVRKPNDKMSITVAADRALSLGFYDSALNLYTGLAAKNPRDPHVLMGEAVAQQKLGMTDAAIQSYNKVLEVSPNNIDAMVNMLGLIKQKDPTGALQHMLALQDRFPDDAGLAAQIGMAEGESGNYREAVHYLGKAAALQPTNPQHPFNMAIMADRNGDAADAVKFYQQALQVDAAADGSSVVDRKVITDRLATLSRR